MSTALRTLRQKRLREVGEAGQARLTAAQAVLDSDGLRADVAARYLVGAGIGRLTAPVAVHAAARAIDPEVALTKGPAGPQIPVAPAFVLDPAAREAFAGAFDALCIIRRILDT